MKLFDDIGLKLELPWPPSVNSLYRAVVRGRIAVMVKTKKQRQYVESVGNQLIGCGPIDGRLDVTIELHAPTKRKYDLDNHVKAILDSLEAAGLYENDEAIDRLTTIRRAVRPRAGVAIVTIQQVKHEVRLEAGQ